MKTLILMRHAKSSWATPGMSDHDRPLNDRGRRAAPVMARWLAERGLIPEAILCSSANRTRQTVRRMRKAVPELPEPVIEPRLYDSGPDDMRACLALLPSASVSAMIVAHEPGMSEMLARLTGCEHGPFPTAALAVLDLDVGEWGEVPWLRGRLREMARPRDSDRALRSPGVMTTPSSGGRRPSVESDDQSVAEVADRIATSIPIASRNGYSR